MKLFDNSCRKCIMRRTVCLCIAALCFLILLFTLRVTLCWGASMEPTISSGRPLAMLVNNAFVTPQRGDIVILRYAEGNKLLIKRLIALPGDTLEIRENQVYVNGTALEEAYLGEAMVTKDVAPILLGPDQYYVLGDNRNISADSRLYGLFSDADILGLVDLDAQLLHWTLLLGLAAAMIVFCAYLPGWDTPISRSSVQDAQDAPCAS